MVICFLQFMYFYFQLFLVFNKTNKIIEGFLRNVTNDIEMPDFTEFEREIIYSMSELPVLNPIENSLFVIIIHCYHPTLGVIKLYFMHHINELRYVVFYKIIYKEYVPSESV